MDDRRQARSSQQRLEDLVLVRIDGALHDVLAQAPGRVDHDHVREPGLGIEREHDTGTADVGTHHALYANRQRHRHVIETLCRAVADRPVGEERGVAAPAGVHERLLAADVEKRLLLPREARVRQVLGSGARTHRDVQLLFPRPAAKLGIGRLNRLRRLLRPLSFEDHRPDRSACVAERRVARFQIPDTTPDLLLQPVGADEIAVGGGRRGETGRDRNPPGPERRDHLAKRRVLSADAADVPSAHVLEQDDERLVSDRCCFTHDQLPWCQEAAKTLPGHGGIDGDQVRRDEESRPREAYPAGWLVASESH